MKGGEERQGLFGQKDQGKSYDSTGDIPDRHLPKSYSSTLLIARRDARDGRDDRDDSDKYSVFTQNIGDLRRKSDDARSRSSFLKDLVGSYQAVNNPYSGLQNDINAVGGHLPISHPNVFEAHRNMLNSWDLERDQLAMDFLRDMRPQRLVGKYKKLANWPEFFKSNIEKMKSKKVQRYYKEQNYLIERFQEIDNLLDYGQVHIHMLSNYEHNVSLPDIEEEEGSVSSADMEPTSPVHKSNRSSRFNAIPGDIRHLGAHFLGYDEEKDSRDIVVAILINTAVNIVLLLGKIVVSLLTHSLSIVASLVDSILDFLSTFIIYIANRLSNSKSWKSQHSYPVGRSRLEPLGVLIFSIIIIVSFFQVGMETVKKLFLSGPEDKVVVKIGTSLMLIMGLTIVSKVCCWVYCANSKSTSVRALAQDAKTDVVFNVVSLLMPLLGDYLSLWWFDALGALVLSIYIIIAWCETAYEHIDNLTGSVASDLDYKVILYLTYRFAESIKWITALKAYHVGDRLNVEIDIVFDSEKFGLTQKDTHDIAEALQYAIESLPMVERAFVHTDYMEGNFKGHLN